MTRPQAIAVPLIDDERVIVTRFEFASGAETGWHKHGHDYVIIAITNCEMLLEEPGGETRAVHVAACDSSRRNKGVEHNVINAGDSPMCFVEVELK